MKIKNVIIFATAFFVLILDQLTKFLIKANFKLNESIPIIKNVAYLTYVTNTGSAFGLFRGLNYLFIFFSISVVILILYYSKKINVNEKSIQFSLGLLMGGALGNLTDRIVGGFVIDFIDFRIWPVFNVADSAVTISVILLIILLWKKD